MHSVLDTSEFDSHFFHAWLWTDLNDDIADSFAVWICGGAL